MSQTLEFALDFKSRCIISQIYNTYIDKVDPILNYYKVEILKFVLRCFWFEML